MVDSVCVCVNVCAIARINWDEGNIKVNQNIGKPVLFRIIKKTWALDKMITENFSFQKRSGKENWDRVWM